MPNVVNAPGRALALAVALALTLVTVVAVGVVGVVGTAHAAPQEHTTLVSPNPRNWTPDVLDGRILSLVEVGDRIVAAGTFSQVREKGDGKPTLSRTNVFSFDPTDGTVDPGFAPVVDDEVQVALPAPDGDSVFLGGAFVSVNGVKTRKVARVQLSDGALFEGFKVSPLDGFVSDARMVRGELVIAGAFLTVGGVERPLLASIDPDTGQRTDFVDVTFSQPRRGAMSVKKIDVTPDGDRLIAIGNFGEVDGQSRPQLAVFDTSGPVASLDGWRTGFFALDRCLKVFWTYMRDLDIDPTGQFFVVTTTGAYGGADSPCDVEARFDLDRAGTDVAPTWRNYTGGDTTYAVEITNTAVYVGGHMRWVNNPFAADREGRGAVPREGIAALDPRSGMPFSWDPGRERGVGVFDFLATDQGLFVGSDTDRLAGEAHYKLGFFPLGTTALPSEAVGSLPSDVYLLGADSAGGDAASRYFLSETGEPRNPAVLGDQPAWSSARGGFLIDDRLYAGWADGTITRRTFDGSSFGPSAELELHDGTFADEVADVTGMFFDPDDGRIYYTMAGRNELMWRGFGPESEIVGPVSSQADGDIAALDPSKVSGMFRSGETLYFVDADSGELWSVGFVGGSVVGPRQLVDGSIDWRSRGAFVWNGTPALAPNVDPVAGVGSECLGLSCSFTGRDSVDPDGGQIVSFDWGFGDGGAAAGEDVSHRFADDGSYSVVLTVTDDRGGQDTVEVEVAVANVAPVAAFTSECVFLQCRFSSTAQDPGGSLDSFVWDFGDGGVSAEKDPVHSYAEAGDYAVSLTVADGHGLEDRVGAVVSAVDPPLSAIGYRDSAVFSGNVTSAQVPVPSSVESGDVLLLFVSSNVGEAPTSVSTGWELVGQQLDKDLLSQLYVRTATGSSAGGEVVVELPRRAKVDLSLLAYSGVDEVAPVAAWAVGEEPDLTAEHAAPELEVVGGKSWVVSYWVDKSSSTTAWAGPVAAQVRSTLIGSGGGRLTSLAVDYDGAVLPGTWPAKVATASDASSRAVMWTLALKSA